MIHEGTILVVEDTHASLKLITDILVAEGYQVRPADSGDLALASVEAMPPELILLDIIMPGMDGFEVLRRLKAQDETCDIPVIILSSLTEVEQRVEGLNLVLTCIINSYMIYSWAGGKNYAQRLSHSTVL